MNVLESDRATQLQPVKDLIARGVKAHVEIGGRQPFWERRTALAELPRGGGDPS